MWEYIYFVMRKKASHASDIKALNRTVLDWFSSNDKETKLEESKNNCERLSYPASFHIDLPIYYLDKESGVCRLATQHDGWLDSDPKAFQDWFDNAVCHLNSLQLARLRRVVKYLKSWISLKFEDGKGRIPSIAITTLVAHCYVDSADDDDAFIETTIKVADHILENNTVDSPINGDDLLGLDNAQLSEARKKVSALKNSCEFIRKTQDSFRQFILWSGTFEHLFPPFTDNLKELEGNSNLPAVTTPPVIKVRHLDKAKSLQSNKVTNTIRAFKGEHLYFSVDNFADYPLDSEVHWMVRNKDKEASLVNDLGHNSVLELTKECNEHCGYRGTHYMECLIISNGNVCGISAVKVNVAGFSKPLRNSTRKTYFKGRK